VRERHIPYGEWRERHGMRHRHEHGGEFRDRGENRGHGPEGHWR